MENQNKKHGDGTQKIKVWTFMAGVHECNWFRVSWQHIMENKWCTGSTPVSVNAEVGHYGANGDRRIFSPRHPKKQKAPTFRLGLSRFNLGDVLLSHTLAHAVPSGLKGLTSVFGMGTGGTPSLGSPKTCLKIPAASPM